MADVDVSKLVEVIIGTYEEFLLGYKIEANKQGNKLSFTQSFATKSHSGSIRCVASSGRYVASGGADDRVFVYDMRDRKEIQILLNHTGTVDDIALTPEATHVITGGTDGKIAAVRLSNGQMEAFWENAHGGAPIRHITCHPSGKLAISIGADLTLRTWNMVKGRQAYVTNLKTRESLGQQCDIVEWSPDGSYFALTGAKAVEIWKMADGKVIHQSDCEHRPVSLCWVSQTDLIIGLENGQMLLASIDREKYKTIDAHDVRVKGIAFLNGILVSISSAGEITAWSVNLQKRTVKRFATTNIGCRPTCITLLDLTQFADEPTPLTQQSANKSNEEIPKTQKNNSKKTRKNIGKVTVELASDDENSVSQNVAKKRKTATIPNTKLSETKKTKVSHETKVKKPTATVSRKSEIENCDNENRKSTKKKASRAVKQPTNKKSTQKHLGNGKKKEILSEKSTNSPETKTDKRNNSDSKKKSGKANASLRNKNKKRKNLT